MFGLTRRCLRQGYWGSPLYVCADIITPPAPDKFLMTSSRMLCDTLSKPNSLCLNQGCFPDEVLSFRTTGHHKYRFWSCVTFCVTLAWFGSPWKSLRPIPDPLSRPVGCFPTWLTFVGAGILNFLFDSRLRFFKAWIWRTIANWFSWLPTGYRSFKRPILLTCINSCTISAFQKLP